LSRILGPPRPSPPHLPLLFSGLIEKRNLRSPPNRLVTSSPSPFSFFRPLEVLLAHFHPWQSWSFSHHHSLRRVCLPFLAASCGSYMPALLRCRSPSHGNGCARSWDLQPTRRSRKKGRRPFTGEVATEEAGEREAGTVSPATAPKRWEGSQVRCRCRFRYRGRPARHSTAGPAIDGEQLDDHLVSKSIRQTAK